MKMTRLIRIRNPSCTERVRAYASKHAVVATLGNFDGVHAGHATLLQEVRQKKTELIGAGQEVVSGIISFHPHPAEVLGKTDRVPRLTTIRQKLRLLAEFDIEFLCLVRFTPAFSQVTAEEFISLYVIELFDVDFLFLGEDAAVGKDRVGTPDFVQERMSASERTVSVSSFAVCADGKKISSGRVRRALEQGEVNEAAGLLGRRYAIESRVVAGDARGRSLGFPTANLKPNEQLLPKQGVYATYARIGDARYPSVSNVGVRPTFGGDDRVQVESHLLASLSLDLVGVRIELEFVERLRDEKRFESPKELQQQIARDVARAKEIFGV